MKGFSFLAFEESSALVDRALGTKPYFILRKPSFEDLQALEAEISHPNST
jgi:hypothetical protein